MKINKFTKKLICATLSFLLFFGQAGFAADFSLIFPIVTSPVITLTIPNLVIVNPVPPVLSKNIKHFGTKQYGGINSRNLIRGEFTNTFFGGVTVYDYTPNGSLSAVTDALGNKTAYAYDGFDRLARAAYADGSDEEYFYDKGSNKTTRVTPENVTITYAYDALNRLTKETYPDGAMTVTFVYDAGSRLKRIYNSFSDVRYSYNSLNRVTQETQKFGALSFIVKSAYDKAGNRTKVTYPSGKVVNYTYNAMNLATGVSVNGVSQASYGYDVLNRLTRRDLLGGTTKRAARAYDSANQLKTLENKLDPSGTLISKHTYTYDLAGNRLKHANKQPSGTVTLNFGYNTIYELTGVTGGQAHAYAYDKVGNRTVADGVTYVSNNLNQYTTVGGSTLSYDFNGNLTQDNASSASYVYDAESRLVQAVKGSTTAQYRYDGFNRRISKEIGAAKTFYVYDGDEIVEERDATGALVADYVYGPQIDEVLTMTRGGQTYYYFYDGLGSVRQITDASGTVLETYDYDVYGAPTTVSALGNPRMFTGREYDPETGLYYYRARYYSPALGRFLQRDPIGYRDGINLYTYVRNNPINLIDPYGLSRKTSIASMANWAKGWGQASRMFFNWSTGTGLPTQYYGSENYFTQSLMDAKGVDAARRAFHEKNKNENECREPEPYTNYSFDFGLVELINAGIDPAEQYIGSYNVSIYPNADGTKTIMVWNRTSMTSATYHRLPSWGRGKFGPGGNMDQWYVWKEPYGR